MISAEQVKSVAIIGAGLMGHGIAQVFALAGIETRLVARHEESLERAMALIEQNLEVLAEFGRAKKEDIPAALGRIHATTDLASAVEGVDFALETVPEIPDTKKEIFAKLSDICPDDAILATNTSTLNIFDFVEVKNPERLLVAHWWLPAHILPLVDVVPGPETSPDAIALTAALMQRVGKHPIVMKKPTTPSIINKIQTSIGMVVGGMLEEGVASPEDIDLAVKMSVGIRMPVIGVVQSLDFTGLDTVYDIMSGYGMVNPVIKEKYDKGHFGVKTSQGLYDYGGRAEAEILEKRDRLYLKLLAVMEELNTFEPV